MLAALTCSLACLCAGALSLSAAELRQGPGVPALEFATAELGKSLFHFKGPVVKGKQLSAGPHNLLAMCKGWLLIVNSGSETGRITFWDLGNPRAPTIAATGNSPGPLSETHTLAMARHEGRDILALLGGNGIEFLDITDINAITRISRVALPLPGGDYEGRTWWLTWQGHTMYVGAGKTGMFIVDTRDLSKPAMVGTGPLLPTKFGLQAIGPVHAQGNLLVITGFAGSPLSMLDIADPHAPRTIGTLGKASGYSATLHGDWFFGPHGIKRDAPKNRDRTVLDPLISLADPRKPVAVATIPNLGEGGYAIFDDRHLFIGNSTRMTIADIGDPAKPVVRQDWDLAHLGVDPKCDADFASPIGHLVALGSDHGDGGYLVPWTEKPDCTPPTVVAQRPRRGEATVPITGRITISFSSPIDFRSADTVRLREPGGGEVRVRHICELGALHLSPEAPLKPGTTYTVEVPAGSVKDHAGNAIAQAYTASFSTVAK